MTTANLLLTMPGRSEWLLIIFCLALLVFWIKTIIEISSSKFNDEGTKIVWLLVTIFLGVFGALIYTLAGRSSRVPKTENY